MEPSSSDPPENFFYGFLEAHWGIIGPTPENKEPRANAPHLGAYHGSGEEELWKTEYQFPLPPEIRFALEERADPFLVFADLDATEVRVSLAEKFAFPAHPHLAGFAARLLENAGLPFLTFLHAPSSSTSSYLSFRMGESEFHLAGLEVADAGFRKIYPFDNIPGLLVFFENFGGMVPSRLPPAPCFWRCNEKMTLKKEDPTMEWGNIGDWVDSLPWYTGPSGDMIIFHPDGTPGVWCHEDSGEQRTWPLKTSFPLLLDELLQYIRGDGTADEQQQNAFYY